MTGRIDALVTLPHYAEHLRPILDAVPPERRGHLYLPQGIAADGYGPFVRGFPTDTDSTEPMLVAGYQDLRYGGRRPKVLVQHGAGQTYETAENVGHASFAGGRGHDLAAMFLCPSERVARLERARYPKAPAVVVGCPKLDDWATVPPPGDGTVAVTFHWQQQMSREVPEAGTCWPEWKERIAQLSRIRPVIAHAHPRARGEVEGWYREQGIEFVPRARDLLDRADILIADNTSLAFEWAALGRHTVWLRGENWSGIQHGPPRFDGQLPGPELQADATVAELDWACDAGGSIRWMLSRNVVRNSVYGGPPIGAAARAAQAIMDQWPDRP